MKNDSKKKRGLMAALWESLTKTGGCCGPGETCGGSTKTTHKTAAKESKESEERAKK